MAKTKKSRQVSQLSCELGEGDFAIGYNAKGRPIRNRRSTIQEPYLEDEACASSEDEDEDDDVDPDFDDVSDSIDVEPTRKRKRKRNWSPSPAMTMPFATAAKHAKFGSCSESADCDDLPPSPSAGPSKPTTLHLAVNIPAGHQGLIRLHLDPTKAAAHLGQATLATTDMLEENARKRWSTTSKTKKKNFQSFLGMSGEVKNHIYRAVFASSTEIDFGAPIRFSRTAALLRTCREVYEEGRSILYGENLFVISRRSSYFGSIWERQWQEIGFQSSRLFFKTIGPDNSMLIQHVKLSLEDASQAMSPHLRSAEDRRFVHDDHLIAVLRHLVKHSCLKTLRLNFRGRRKVDRVDDRFLDYVKSIKADEVTFHPHNSSTEAVEEMLKKSCTRRRKLFSDQEKAEV